MTHEDILNHWLLALEEKNKKLEGRTLKSGLKKTGYLEQKIVQQHEPYIIALNTCRLEQSNKPVDLKVSALKTAFGNTGIFSNPDYAGVSAILCTSQGIDVVQGRKAPIILIHNPNARNQAPSGLWGVDQEYRVDS